MTKNIRILILEDRESDADLIEYELMEAGLAVTPKLARNEKEYLRGLEEFFPDLILADYDLPQYTGALAFAEAKRRIPEVPFILVTGMIYENNDRVAETLVQGANDYVLKHHLHRLAPAIKKALGMDAGS